MGIKINLVTVTKLKRVLWFIVRNPFLIIKRAFKWALTLAFWLFVLGWGISAFAIESTPAKYIDGFKDEPVRCEPNMANYNYSFGLKKAAECVTAFTSATPSTTSSGQYKGPMSFSAFTSSSTTFTPGVLSTIKANFCVVSNPTECFEFLVQYFGQLAPRFTGYVCPPDGKPDFTVGPVDLNGTKVCQKQPITCKMGEIKTVSQSTGAEACQENCKAVAGQGMTGAAYNQAFLPSATVTCYGSCSVISQGTTVELPADGFTQHGDIQFTGDKCPVKFPEQGNGQPVYNDQPTSSDETAAAQDQLQNAASGATSNPISGATGTADLNAVVDKLAQTSNAEIKAMSDQNAALGKVIEGVGKDIQGAIREGNANSGGGGASIGQMQMANAIKDGNEILGEISDKLDNQQDSEQSEPPVKPGTVLDADATAIHEANDWGQRNFGTVLTANAERFRALPIFSLPTNFFTANFSGSACPDYSGSFTLLGASTDVGLTAFCSSTVRDVMPFIRAVVMLVFGWLAWRIAIGNGG